MWAFGIFRSFFFCKVIRFFSCFCFLRVKAIFFLDFWFALFFVLVCCFPTVRFSFFCGLLPTFPFQKYAAPARLPTWERSTCGRFNWRRRRGFLLLFRAFFLFFPSFSDLHRFPPPFFCKHVFECVVSNWWNKQSETRPSVRPAYCLRRLNPQLQWRYHRRTLNEN